MNNVYMDGPSSGVPQITGKWYNKRTGQTIFVRDAYFMDDGMQVQTSTGEFIDGQTFSNEYIQMDENIYDEQGNVTGTETVDYDAMFNNVSYIKTGESKQELVESNFIVAPTNEPTIITGFTENNQAQVTGDSMYTPSIPVKVSTLDTYKLDILNKFFNSFKELPEIKFSVKWNKLPEYEINLMKTVFNVSEDDIAIYITEKYCDNQTIIESIKDDIKLKLDPKKEVVKKSSKKIASTFDDKKEKIEVKETDKIFIEVEKEPSKEIKKIPPIKGRKPSKR
jgi:hypothetical protein